MSAIVSASASRLLSASLNISSVSIFANNLLLALSDPPDGGRHSFRAGRLREIGGTKGNGGSIMGGAIPGASGTSISASRLTCSVPEVTGAATPVMDRPEPKGPPVSFGPPQTSGRA